MNSHGISIGSAAITDMHALAGLLDELFTIEKDFTPNRPRQLRGLELLLADPARGVIKIARNEKGTPIGMITVQLVISTAQGAASAWIEDMIVSADYRRLGIGRRLIDEALAWARAKGATRAQLLVDMANDPALEYYRQLGWQETQLQARRIFL